MVALEVYTDIGSKDTLIDFLFEQGFDDFFCIPCHKYASPSKLLSEKEQVSGCKDYTKVRLFLQEEEAIRLGKAMRERFVSKDIRLFYSQVHEC
ncbi:DUF3240 family protein [Helicobacter cetorum]|uniref:DUF3240 family protein n=1 Tax=Helicobacter cetorum TaxID=138563 RepID=UPI000CF1BCF6|nr:DUF3240 family protein [Helicobacter cetorum]